MNSNKNTASISCSSTEGSWINHCEPPCGLGQFEYDCPVCRANVYSCDLWFQQDYVYVGFDFQCEKCKAPLFCKWNNDESASIVSFNG